MENLTTNQAVNQSAQSAIARGLHKVGSPLYGPDFIPPHMSGEDAEVNVSVLQKRGVQNAIKEAKEVHLDELKTLGYSPLTINSYSSAIERFNTFIEVGQVVPDKD